MSWALSTRKYANVAWFGCLTEINICPMVIGSVFPTHCHFSRCNRLVLDDAGYGKTEPSSSSGVFLEVAAAAAVGGLPEETDRGRALIGEHVTAGGYQLNPSTNDSPLPSRMHKASLDAERPPPPSGSSNNRGVPDRARNKTFCSSVASRYAWVGGGVRCLDDG